MTQYIVFLGALIQLAGGAVYILDTLKGTTKPNRVTWFLWMLAPYIATAAALADGVTWAVLPIFMGGFIPMLVLFASFVNKDAYWKLTSFDYKCGILSLLALFLWYITGQPIVAIAFSIAADGLASLPTLIKSWRFPETESGLQYVADLLGGISGFFAIKMGSASEYAPLIYFLIINLALVFAVYRKRWRLTG